ncbi:hypothetical protein PMAYCL1PPCAC_16769, partial [Pristionchus mayeri]
SSVGMTHNETSVIPAVGEWRGEPYYYIPYEYELKIGPELLWDGEWAGTLCPNYSLVAHTVWMAVAYSVVMHAAQKLMENREPIKLRLPLILWNAGLALFSLCGSIRMGEEFFHVLRTRSFLDSVSFAVNIREPAAFWCGAFALSKIFELGDTVFVVARKKELIFLHWYHHAVVLVYSFHSSCEAIAGGRWFVFMNYSVHAVMYTYYALAAADFRFPKWCSMIVTVLQTSQMFIGVCISCTVLYVKMNGGLVQQSWENLLLCFTIYFSFAILFMNFFIQTYLKKKEKKVKDA